jgi:hypothetical protein
MDLPRTPSSDYHHFLQTLNRVLNQFMESRGQPRSDPFTSASHRHGLLEHKSSNDFITRVMPVTAVPEPSTSTRRSEEALEFHNLSGSNHYLLGRVTKPNQLTPAGSQTMKCLPGLGDVRHSGRRRDVVWVKASLLSW